MKLMDKAGSCLTLIPGRHSQWIMGSPLGLPLGLNLLDMTSTALWARQATSRPDAHHVA